VPGRAQAVGRDRVAQVAERSFGRGRLDGDDLRSERVGAEARICGGLGAAQAVVDVQRRHVEAELAESVEEASRVGAARNEAHDVATRGNQVVPADVRFDPVEELQIRSVPGSAKDG
jgi:hypothetical protein